MHLRRSRSHRPRTRRSQLRFEFFADRGYGSPYHFSWSGSPVIGYQYQRCAYPSPSPYTAGRSSKPSCRHNSQSDPRSSYSGAARLAPIGIDPSSAPAYHVSLSQGHRWPMFISSNAIEVNSYTSLK